MTDIVCKEHHDTDSDLLHGNGMMEKEVEFEVGVVVGGATVARGMSRRGMVELGELG